jgi:hypothetical protein
MPPLPPHSESDVMNAPSLRIYTKTDLTDMPQTQYEVVRNGVSLGFFSIQDLSQKFTSSELLGSDMVRAEGLTEWQTLQQVIEEASETVKTPAIWRKEGASETVRALQREIHASGREAIFLDDKQILDIPAFLRKSDDSREPASEGNSAIAHEGPYKDVEAASILDSTDGLVHRNPRTHNPPMFAKGGVEESSHDGENSLSSQKPRFITEMDVKAASIAAQSHLDAPTEMRFGRTAKITYRIAQDELFKSETAKPIRMTSLMGARLVGSGFSIREQGREDKAMDPNVVNTWSWEVTPEKAGTHELQVIVTGYLKLDGDTIPREYVAETRTVRVRVSVGSYLRQNWLALTSLAVAVQAIPQVGDLFNKLIGR